MEQSLSELLSAAFSDASFPDEELCFENLSFDERCEEDERSDTDEGRTLHQEGTGDSAVLCSIGAKDVNTRECSDDEELFQGVYKPREGNSTSSEEEEEKVAGVTAGELLMSLHCRDKSGHGEETTFAEGLPVAPQGADNPQVRNQEQGESGEEEVSYFQRVPEMVPRGDGAEGHERTREGAKSDCESESMRVEPRDGPATLEFPEISVQNLQDLIAKVDLDRHFEKMKEFSGVEHEEAGESLADFPSDFSSGEYVEDGVKHRESDPLPHEEKVSVVDAARMDTSQQGDRNLCSLSVETDADEFRGFQGAGWYSVTGEETDESDSYDLEKPNGAEDTLLCSPVVSRWIFDLSNNADTRREAVPTAEDAGTAAPAAPAHVSQPPAGGRSMVESEDSSIYRGSLDDDFFLDSDVRRSGVAELGALGDDDEDDDDDEEEERSWEQEQDSDQEDEREERRTRFQFSAELQSQVIHNDTDSSDRDSLSSSTEAEEDSSSAETSEEVTEPDDGIQKTPVRDAPGEDRGRGLQLMRRMGLVAVMVGVTAMGLAMYLLATEHQH